MKATIAILEAQMTAEAIAQRLEQINLRLLIIDIKINSLKNKIK